MKRVSEIDRLIELASDRKPSARSIEDEAVAPKRSLSLKDEKDPGPSMWRALIQLRVLLPYLAKVLPLVERGLLGTNLTGHAAPNLDTTHFDRGIAELEGAHRDVGGALKTQTSEIKFLQEQVTWLSQSIEKDLVVQQELAATLASARKAFTVWAAVIVVLLVALIVLVALAAFGSGLKAG